MRSSLDPTLDVVFKLLFAAPESKATLIALLTAVLKPPVPIADVEVLNPDVGREDVDDKGTILDIFVRLADGRRLDVEMQARKQTGFRDRALYYWARLYGAQLEAGMVYTDLVPVISVLFLDYRELEARRFHSTFHVLEVHDAERLSEGLEIHVIELPKLAAVTATELQDEAALVAWSTFLGADDDDAVEKVCMAHPDIAEAKRTLDRLSADPHTQELARRRKLAQLTLQHTIAAERKEARAEGREEGRAEGRAEGREEGRAEGRAEGREEGKQEGRRAALLAILEGRGFALSESDKARVLAAGLADLERWIPRALHAASLAEVLETR